MGKNKKKSGGGGKNKQKKGAGGGGVENKKNSPAVRKKAISGPHPRFGAHESWKYLLLQLCHASEITTIYLGNKTMEHTHPCFCFASLSLSPP
ncbi:hypothetical protein GBAR_LOCUS26842, partial [Geodia barretti]